MLRCFLNERMLMGSEPDDKPHKIIDEGEIPRICDTFRLDDEQTLKGMYYFLNLLPLVWTLFDLLQITINDLINFLVLLDEYQQKVMSSFPHFSLNIPNNLHFHQRAT